MSPANEMAWDAGEKCDFCSLKTASACRSFCRCYGRMQAICWTSWPRLPLPFSSVAAASYELLLIIDLGLPDGDGLAAIRSLRASGISRPILIITARGSIDDRISGLDAGADDYLTKPFNHAELLARVRALLRRPSDLQGPLLRRGRTEFDQAKDEVRCSGHFVQLRLQRTPAARSADAPQRCGGGKIRTRGDVVAVQPRALA